MKKFIVMLVILAGSLLAGCSTPVDTGSERWTRMRNISVIQTKQFNDDLDYLFLLERSSSLSEWHARVGR